MNTIFYSIRKSFRRSNPVNLLIVILLVIIALLTRGLFHEPSATTFSKNLVVEFSENGFSPSEITISKGTMITFVNKTKNPFWPASNLHPTHTLYPEFDAKKPVDSGKSWSFTFEKEGEWKYHDHLSPLDRGTVIVILPGVKEARTKYNCQDTSAKSDKLQLRCWDELVDSILKNHSIDDAFDIVADRYKQSPLFARNCHVYIHKIGQAAYIAFKEGKQFSISPSNGAFCGFGFYHGFMETLRHTGGDLTEARRLCDEMIKKSTSVSAAATVGCFHGIGHGNTDIENDLYKGDERTVVASGLKLCDQITKTSHEVYGCASGVFNSLTIAYVFKRSGMVVNKTDPFWICREQQEKYKASCYNDMNIAVWQLSNHDLVKAAHYANQIKEDDNAQEALRATTTLLVRDKLQDGVDFTETLPTCKILGDRFYWACVKGLAGGLMEFGEPGNEYIKAFNICRSGLLSAEFKNVCFTYVIDQGFNRYTPEKMQAICKTLEPPYNGGCNRVGA